ncbi:MAG: hypothetical protein WD579_03635 [Candidatus Paceibacterota bacterium]
MARVVQVARNEKRKKLDDPNHPYFSRRSRSDLEFIMGQIRAERNLNPLKKLPYGQQVELVEKAARIAHESIAGEKAEILKELHRSRFCSA